MSGAVGVIAFISTLLVVIVFHEFGHFITAKRFGIKVEEFFVGFGPRLFARKKGETTFGLKAILIGGYVKISGMNPWQPVPVSDLPRTFGSKPAWQRAIVLFAGSFTHFVLSFLVLLVLFGAVGTPRATTQLDEVQSRVEAPADLTLDGSDLPGPAAQAGLRAGDRIISIDGRSVRDWEDVRNTIRNNPGRTITIGVLRDGARLNFSVMPVVASGQDEQGNPITVGLVGIVPTAERVTDPIHVAAGNAAATTGSLIVQSFRVIGTVFSPEGLGRIFSALGESGARGLEDPIGPVGGGRLAGQAATAGEIDSLVFTLISFTVIIGVFNLLPLPPLDGGYLLIVLIEKIRGRKVDLRRVAPVMAVVLSFLVFISLALLYLDIARPVTNPFE